MSKSSHLFLAAGLASAAGCGIQGEIGPSMPGLVMEDSYSPTGALIVARDVDGQLSVAIRGRIGVDSDAIGENAIGQPSLADVYVALHPGAREVPSHVQALSEELKAQRRANLRGIALAPAPQPSNELADQEGFQASVCKVFGGGFAGWSPLHCAYQEDTQTVCTPEEMKTGDASIGWNETPFQASHGLTNRFDTFAIPPFTWIWSEWGGKYSHLRACVMLGGDFESGHLGVTHHRSFTDSHSVEL